MYALRRGQLPIFKVCPRSPETEVKLLLELFELLLLLFVVLLLIFKAEFDRELKAESEALGLGEFAELEESLVFPLVQLICIFPICPTKV